MDRGTRRVIFGPFCLLPEQRLLLEDGRPLRLGSRALDILIALVDQRGELLTKAALVERVWPDTKVVEENLSVHVAALRRALQDGVGHRRYIVTVPGRGYGFVAATVTTGPEPADIPADTVAKHNLPVHPTSLFGRDETIAQLSDGTQRYRLVTVTGPGGVGKSAVAIATAGRQVTSYRNGVWLVDLAACDNPVELPGLVAAALSLDLGRDAMAEPLASILSDQDVLIVLDNCERVIDAVAELVHRLLSQTPMVRVLATSREPMRLGSERVYRLSPLSVPPHSPTNTANDVADFPAVRMFVDRAEAASHDFTLNDANVQAVIQICRLLDGLPLALELAAPQVVSFGVSALAEQVGIGLDLISVGRRLAPDRHQSLGASLDWSFALLSEAERAVLCRLADFSGRFSWEAARIATSRSGIAPAQSIECLANLIAKSLVIPIPHLAHVCYTLLNTTRLYLLEKARNGAARSHVDAGAAEEGRVASIRGRRVS